MAVFIWVYMQFFWVHSSFLLCCLSQMLLSLDPPILVCAKLTHSQNPPG